MHPCSKLISLEVFYVAIDSHDIYIIETDGVEMEPYKIDVLTIAVAQRYSLLVVAKNDTSQNYAMSIMQDPDMSVTLMPWERARESDAWVQVRYCPRQLGAQQHGANCLRLGKCCGRTSVP